MSGFCMLVCLISFIAFIVYWWKKRKARKAAGEDYRNDSTYQNVSKIKRIIGIVCVVSFVLGVALVPSQSPEEKARIQAEQQAKAEKEAAEKAKKEAQANIERVATLAGEDKNLYEAKFQEYMGSMDESNARAKALADVDNAVKVRKEAEAKAKAEQEAAEAAAKKAQEEKNRVASAFSSGWDDSALKDNQKNFEKAIDLVATHTDYIRSANPEYPSLQVALKNPWKYYGKVVCISGPVGTVTQEPPGQSLAKYWGGEYFHTVIQGDFPVAIHIKGVADNIREGEQIRVRGLIVGQTDLQNMMGGSPVGLQFVGILDQ